MQKQTVCKLLLLCMLCCQQTQQAQGARILAAFIFPGRSHFMMTNALIRELVHRGHEVTFITPFSLADEQLGQNYTEIVLSKYDIWGEILAYIKADSISDATDLSLVTTLKLCEIMGAGSSNFALEQPALQAIIHDKNPLGKYDLLLAEQFFNEPALALAQLYQIPSILVSTFGYANIMSSMVGIISPWSYVPHNHMPFNDRMTFTQRLQNSLLSLYEDLQREFSYFPAQNAVLRKHFSHLPGGAPTVAQLERNVSVMLLNNYLPLVSPRPTSFNMIPVGGLHILPTKPLPAHLQKFLDEAEHGVIYFSLGTQVRSADMPAEKRQHFLKVFGSLKQRVLWKFEDESLTNLPANVMVQKWMPQNDILAHKNVRVFITHGGLFGTQEAVYHGVPMLGMPVYSDQHLNIHKAKEAGYALGLNYATVTESDLRPALLELLENPKYRTKMATVSRVFRDRPSSAMDTAIYWIDYVIAHRGAPHLVPAALDLTWYQFYLVDVVLFVVAVISVPIILIILLVRKFICKRSKLNPKKLKTK